MPGVESRTTCSSACRGRYGPPSVVSTRRSRMRAADPGPGRDLLDDLALRVGVVLNERPLTFHEFALRRLVQGAVVVVGSEPIPEPDHPVHLDTAGREDVEVDVRIRPLEEAGAVPLG